MLVTAEHTKRNVKHDATTVWVENIRMNTFKVCVRELQNFDGQHKDIKVVSDKNSLWKEFEILLDFPKVARFSLNGPGTNDFYHLQRAKFTGGIFLL